MPDYLIVPIDQYGSITVEIQPTRTDRSGFEPLSLQEDAQHALDVTTRVAADAFDKISESIHALAYGFWDRINSIDEKIRPDEASVKFVVSIRGETNVIVAKAAADACFEIKLKWQTK